MGENKTAKQNEPHEIIRQVFQPLSSLWLS